jgi:hypothetical protein
MQITEIYKSIQGESTYAGLPCVFVRLTGCNLRCSWCDSEYTFTGGHRRTLEEVIEAVEQFSPGGGLVEITGGEPMLQEREVVPLILIRLGLMGWACPEPLVPPPSPFSIVIDHDYGPGWYKDPREARSRTAVLHDLIRLSVGQDEGVDREKVLQEAIDHGMLVSPDLAILVARAGLVPSAAAENGVPAVRQARVRVVDV